MKLLGLLVAVFGLVSAQLTTRGCRDGVDVYMVLDHSASTVQCVNPGPNEQCTNQFVTNVGNLVEALIDTFKAQENFRLSLTIFGTGGAPFLPLTNSVKAMQQGVNSLRKRVGQVGAGWTHMEKGMDLAVADMSRQPASIFKLLFLVTDGDNTGHPAQMQYYAEQVRAQGGLVFSVGIADATFGGLSNQAITTLTALANQPDSTYFLRTTSFAGLAGSLASLNSTLNCLDIESIGPCSQFVQDQDPPLHCCAPWSGNQIQILGKGFIVPLGTPENVTCRFDTWEPLPDDQQPPDAEFPVVVFLTYYTTGTLVSQNEIICEAPPKPLNNLTTVEFKLTSDPRYDYTNSKNYLYVYPADSPECVPLPVVFPFWAILLAIPFILFLLWFFFPALPKKKKIVQSQENVMVPPEIMQTMSAPITPPVVPLAPPPEPPPETKKKVRKWAKVDTSHYIWSRDGGSARPMEVAWGKSGAPESAPVRDAADIQFDVIQEGGGVQQQVAAPPPVIQPMAPSTPFMDNSVVDDPNFDDIEWDRCCCGMCASSACSCCKSGCSRLFVFCSFVSTTWGSLCIKCLKVGKCYGCYKSCDRLRPRWDCCGVKKSGSTDTDGGGMGIDRQNTSTAGYSGGGYSGGGYSGGGVEMNPMGGGGLPYGWEEFKSDEGHTYYYNAQKDLSQYNRPTGPNG